MGLRPTHTDENRFEPGVTIERAQDGEGRPYSGSVEAVSEFGLGCVFWTNLCRTGEYFIEAMVPDDFTLFNEPRVELFGGILHYFVREILEHFGPDPEIIENVKRGHYSFLFKEDGSLLTDGGGIHVK